MESNVVPFPGMTKISHRPEQILRAAIDADLDTVIVLGHTKSGEFWFSGNKSDAFEALWLLERAKPVLLASEGE